MQKGDPRPKRPATAGLGFARMIQDVPLLRPASPKPSAPTDRWHIGAPDHVTLAACRHGGMTELGDAEETEQEGKALPEVAVLAFENAPATEFANQLQTGLVGN